MKAKVEADRRSREDETRVRGLPAVSGTVRSFRGPCPGNRAHGKWRGGRRAACLWALRQAEQGRARKLIFLLPTMVTANSLHGRLVKFFTERHGHEVGLVHSTAELINNRMEGNEADRTSIRRSSLWEPHFFPPVVVGTVDQLLMTLFHAGRWAMKTLAAADAAIVIDEVHAYDPHTAGR